MVLLYAVWMGLPAGEVIIWSLMAVAATVLIDLDHLYLQLLMRDRRHIVYDILSHPLEHTDWRKIVDKTHYPGFGMLRMESHLLQALAATIILIHFNIPYSTPVILSMWVHCTQDMYAVIKHPDWR